MLPEYYLKVKQFLRENRNDLYIAAVIFLVGISSFGLGRLSAIWPQKEPITIENFGTTADTKNTPSNSSGRYVASQNGAVYHFPWCSGAQRIKEENKVWFLTKEEAEKLGYRAAGNCEGL